MTIRFHWGTGIAVAYTAFALATVGFVAFAMNRPVDLVSPDYYAESLRHDARMTAQANARALGTAFEVRLLPGRRLDLSWPLPMAAQVRGEATFYRPSSAALDVTVPLAVDAAGRQRIDIGALAPGYWQVRLAWQAGGRDFLAVRDILVTAGADER